MTAQNVYQRRLVGDQPGVQVNMPVDQTDRVLPGLQEQTVATVGHFNRGRIDKPFLVTPDKMKRMLGKSVSLRVDPMFSTYLNIYDAFSNGAAAAVISRLSSSSATLDWLIASHDSDSANVWSTGAQPTAGSGTWMLAIKVADAINEGVYAEIYKSTETEGYVGIRIRERSKDSSGNDTDEGEILYEVEGSLDPAAVDEFNNTAFIADMAEKYYQDWIEIEVNTTGNAIDPTDAFNSATVGAGLDFYSDTGTLTTADYQGAVDRLKNTNLKYRIMFINSPVTDLVNAMMKAAVEINRGLYIEIDGKLTATAAITWKDQFNYKAQEGMYYSWIITPLKRNDPTGASGRELFGSVGQKAGYFTVLNSSTNAHGIPRLNQPIAGKGFFLQGTGIEQIQQFNDVDKAQLAKAHINPCVFSEYHDGYGYVWEDSLSGAKRNGISKLESVAAMSAWIQDYLGKYAKGLTQLPMTTAIRRMEKFCEDLGQKLQASEWLVPSASLGGSAYIFTVKRNERFPDDRMDVDGSFGFDGVTRKIHISQNMHSVD